MLGRVENTKNYKMFFLEKEKKIYIYIRRYIYLGWRWKQSSKEDFLGENVK